MAQLGRLCREVLRKPNGKPSSTRKGGGKTPSGSLVSKNNASYSTGVKLERGSAGNTRGGGGVKGGLKAGRRQTNTDDGGLTKMARKISLSRTTRRHERIILRYLRRLDDIFLFQSLGVAPMREVKRKIAQSEGDGGEGWKPSLPLSSEHSERGRCGLHLSLFGITQRLLIEFVVEPPVVWKNNLDVLVHLFSLGGSNSVLSCLCVSVFGVLCRSFWFRAACTPMCWRGCVCEAWQAHPVLSFASVGFVGGQGEDVAVLPLFPLVTEMYIYFYYPFVFLGIYRTVSVSPTVLVSLHTVDRAEDLKFEDDYSWLGCCSRFLCFFWPGMPSVERANSVKHVLEQSFREYI